MFLELLVAEWSHHSVWLLGFGWCRGFGKWMLKMTKGYFDNGAETSEQEDLPENSAGKWC